MEYTIHDTSTNGASQRLYQIRKDGEIRQTTVVSAANQRFSPQWQQIKDAFLPVGFPESVTEDYLPYQIYDSLQAFCSSIAGLLSSRAVLQGYGVGDATASATSTVLLTIVQDSISRLSTILFASRFSTSLSPHSKRYRLLADIFNDAAMVLDCLSPAIPTSYGLRLTALCASGTLRALCGVAAGGTKAGLSSHFAKTGNVAELNAKDSSQETLISLLGLLGGTLVIRLTPTPLPTFPTLILLLGLHLYCNYLAVRSVRLRTLNSQRLILITKTFTDNTDYFAPGRPKLKNPTDLRSKLTLAAIAGRENILFYNSRRQPSCSGIPNTVLLAPPFLALTSRLVAPDVTLPALLKIFEREPFLIWLRQKREDLPSKLVWKEAIIVLKQGVTSEDIVKAWMLAEYIEACRQNRIFVVWQAGMRGVVEEEMMVLLVRRCVEEFGRVWEERRGMLVGCGWDLNDGMLEEGGFRVRIEEGVVSGVEQKKME
ncbi:DUF647-domain-containing protein [Ascobolus immersus RN42]|uniref:DUF647-domain-containing protein n=1 Tax=Ascobolus immersus RN42 TaxID=1160509 RepID=A0A3N4I5Q8_ASCIM|nr:DUF647-domain-containing protein [Ascobolus immersus RN42]